MKSLRFLAVPVLLMSLAAACAEGSPVDEESPGVAGSAGADAGDGAAGQGGSGKGGAAGTSGQSGSDASAGGASTGGASGSAGAGGGSAGTGGAAGSGTGGTAGSGGMIINTGGSAGSAGKGGAAGAGGSAGSSGGAGTGGASTGGSAGAGGAVNTGGSAGAGGVVNTGGSAGSGGTGGAAGTGGSPCVPPVSGTCDTLPQCGCLPAENCDVVTVAGETSCVTAGQVPPYNNCSNFGECEAGHTCVSGVCKPFCDTVAECPGTYRACDQVYADTTPIPSFKVCTQQCNPRAPQQNTGGFSACGPNTLCNAMPSGSSDCIGPAGTGVQSTPCTLDTDCSPGYTCVQVDVGDVRCVKWCTSDYDCPGVLYCYTLSTPLFVGTTEYGICF